MPDDPRPPVAIRITRPYASEDELLENELDALARTSVTLLGAQPRPQGVVLRFELVLSSGQVLLRGEGRVVGFKPNALHGIGGLTLRFTRLDTKSKALVDKASALRDKKRPVLPGGSGRSSSRPPPRRSDPEVAGEGPRDSIEIAGRLSPVPAVVEPAPAAAAPPARPAERDALLDKLRLRAKKLDAPEVERILAQRMRARRLGGPGA